MPDKSTRTKKQIISDLMRYSNYTRPQAEAAAAIELGEVPGDVIELPEDDDESGDTDD